jgi:imidazolonepropionase-like amidohydrolase
MISRRLLLAAACLLGLSGAAFAETPAPPKQTYITADRLIDVVSGRVIERAAVLIEGERIVASGAQSAVPAPADARRIDLAGSTLLPGLIDLHVHLTSRHDMHGYRRLALSPTDEAIIGVENAKITLEAGFTTARNVGARGYADVSLKRAIEDGRVPGPRLFVSGPAMSMTGGHMDNNLLPPQWQARGEGVADGPWEVRAKVRELRKYGADLVKFASTGGVLSRNTPLNAVLFTMEEMKAIVDEAHQLGMKVAVHAHGTAGIKNAIIAGADTIEHSSFIDAEGIELAKKSGAWLAMDIYTTEFILAEGEKMGILPESLAKEREVGQRQRENFRSAVKAGARHVFATDAGVYPHGQNARQFRVMVEFGMSPIQAIQAATINAAQALGQEANIGSLQAGRYADLIAVPGNPLQNVRLLEDVPFVMKGGAVVKGR